MTTTNQTDGAGAFIAAHFWKLFAVVAATAALMLLSSGLLTERKVSLASNGNTLRLDQTRPIPDTSPMQRIQSKQKTPAVVVVKGTPPGRITGFYANANQDFLILGSLPSPDNSGERVSETIVIPWDQVVSITMTSKE